MAKAETIGKPPIRRDGTSASLRDYTSLLGVVAAGILGMSLLCITSAIALSNPDPANPIVLEPASIVDMAIQNLNTVSALTVQAVAVSIDDSTPTPTLGASALPPSPTLTSSAFPTLPRFTSTATRRPRATFTPTRVPPTNTPRPPTNTPIPAPTRTLVPSPTNTLIPPPTFTATPEPPTATDEPPTATDEPPTATDAPTDEPTATEPPATLQSIAQPTETP
ncbi:MAG: hypothetical protein M3R47_16355 [Chloroflexota bacterium]|nr:hypothetical protein [Chloroflexota bacterium]